MEQRSLRLGDIVDDYCPRERRLTNHAVVAIVEGAIRQTRCTTCDHEHVYKEAREPRRRKPPTQSLFDQVLTDVGGTRSGPARIVAPVEPGDEPAGTAIVPDDPEVEVETPAEVLEAAMPVEPAEPQAGAQTDDVWPGHRTLIRATLPRPPADAPPVRPIPEFTMHQKPQSGRARHSRLIYGPQGDPFGRPTRDGQAASGRGHGNGREPDGNSAGGPAAPPSKRRGRRRRRGGKRSH